MKYTVSWLWIEKRSAYHVRKLSWGIDPRTQQGRRFDTKSLIPDEHFERAGVSGRTRTAAGDKLALRYALSLEERLNTTPERPWMTLREIGELWLDRRKRKDEKTLASDALILNRLCEHFGERQPSTIDIGSMEDYRDARLEAQWTPRLGTKGVRTISPRTVYNEVSFMKRLLEFAYARRSETGMTEINLLEVPEIENKAGNGGARKLTMEEFWRAYEAAAELPRAGDRTQVMLALALSTWLRLEALVNLQQSWIDHEAKTVTIPREFMKGGKKELILPLSRFALSAIERSMSMHKGERFVLPVNRSTGRPANNLFHTFAAVAETAGLRPFSLHGIRKCAATTLLNHRCEKHPNGVPKIVGDTILAHALPRNDEAYLSVDLDVMRDALSVFDELWQERNRRADAQVVDLNARRA